MNTIIAVLLAYLGVLVALAIWSRRETRTLSGFFLAGKKLPFWVIAFSMNATGESGWLLLGLTGMGYAVGAQAYWVVVGEIIGVYLAWTLIARRIKKLSDQTDSITVPDVLAARFDDKLHILRIIAIVIILTMVCAYVSAQLVASGKAFSSFIDIDYHTAVVLGAVIIISYTFVGGFKAVAYTDVVQGVLMLFGLILVPTVAIGSAGGWAAVSANLAAQDPALLDMWQFGDGGIASWVALFSFMAIGLPFLGAPQLMSRFMSASDEGQIPKARTVSIIVILLFDVGAVTAGMAGRALFPGLDDAETIFPVLATELFPALITGLLMVIVLSAIMSTVDSLLLLASSAVVRDGMQKVLGSQRDDRALAGYGKLVTILIGAIALVFALQEVKLIFWFVLFAWSGLGAAFGPVLVCTFYYRKTNLPGVAAGMLGGFLVSVFWVLFVKEYTYDLYEMIPGFIVGMLLTIVVSNVTARRYPPPAALEGAGDA
ncbi:MAG: sodium/proline symporter [Woeseia sp.]|nr:sodium/proline symporter [Woeseia sp.]NNE60865.1 sodium/proline symporter [Woeseia sp.]